MPDRPAVPPSADPVYEIVRVTGWSGEPWYFLKRDGTTVSVHRFWLTARLARRRLRAAL